MPADVSQVLAWGMDLPTYKGKVYHLSEPDQIMKAKYEDWLKRTAMEECIAASEGLNDKQKETNLKMVLADLALKKYRWGGPFWAESLQGEPGMKRIIGLMLKDNRKREVAAETVDAMLQDDTMSPWLLGAVYVVCGMDPSMALTAGQMTVVEASKQRNVSLEMLSQIMSSKPESLSVASPNSGLATPG